MASAIQKTMTVCVGGVQFPVKLARFHEIGCFLSAAVRLSSVSAREDVGYRNRQRPFTQMRFLPIHAVLHGVTHIFFFFQI